MASHEEQNVAVVRRFIDGAVNGRDPAVIDETWSDDLLWHGGSLGMFDGKAAFKSAFIANDDKVVLRFTNSGTNVGPFMGNPPTSIQAEKCEAATLLGRPICGRRRSVAAGSPILPGCERDAWDT